MAIIDCHTHIGRNEHIGSTVDELLKSMDNAKIDRSFVFAGALSACPNEFMLKQISHHKDRLSGVMAFKYEIGRDFEIQYLDIQIKQMQDWYEEGKIVAVKFYTGYDHYFPMDVTEMLMEMEKVGCPAIFHMGDCLNSAKCAKIKYAHPIHIDDVAVDFPGMNFIIAHMGYPWHRDVAEICYKNSNVYTDISGFVYKDFTGSDKIKFYKTLYEFLDIADSDKLLFGTDWPISNQDSYLEALDWAANNTNSSKMFEVFTPQYMSQNTKKVFKI